MRTIAVGERVLVRLARLPGMPDEDPSPEELLQMRMSLQEPALFDKVLTEQREQRDNPDFSADMLTEELALYPRVRPATIAFVDRTAAPAGRGSVKVNLDVFTPGSTVLQPAVGKIPKWACQHFRLDGVQMFVREPDDGHEQHVAFWPAESEEEAPARRE